VLCSESTHCNSCNSRGNTPGRIAIFASVVEVQSSTDSCVLKDRCSFPNPLYLSQPMQPIEDWKKSVDLTQVATIVALTAS